MGIFDISKVYKKRRNRVHPSLLNIFQSALPNSFYRPTTSHIVGEQFSVDDPQRHAPAAHHQQTSPTTATTMEQNYPQDIVTVPNNELHLNAPFDIKTIYNLRIINTGTRRIGYAFKTTKPRRIFINPPCGTLGAGDTLSVIITSAAFDMNNEELKRDRVTVEWCNTPDPAATVFNIEWFQEDGMVRRKNLPVVYNL